MNILLLGSGGREHALAWKLASSIHCTRLYIAPGNGGTMQHGINVEVDITDFPRLKEFCLAQDIQMLVVGPEEPLVKGIYDFFQSDTALQHINVIGPSKAAAQLEGSKAFAKGFMSRHNIPTAGYREFSAAQFEEAKQHLKGHSLPIVLKADGLAAGKGVLILNTIEEAEQELELILKQQKFGAAGDKVVIEEFLEGVELSVFVLTDGKDYVVLPEAKDYKRIGEGDTGLNTGGMGAVSPVPFAGDAFMRKITATIIEPTIKGLQQEGLVYKGFIFLGLIAVNDQPFVIEYNCRLGDPETEVVLIRLRNDLIELLQAVGAGTLSQVEIDTDKRAAATIVAVSGGYPGEYEKGKEIALNYLDNPETSKHIGKEGGVMVFHAGTVFNDNKYFTNGGRVLCASSLADNIGEAVEGALETLNQVNFEGIYYRRDIGAEFLD